MTWRPRLGSMRPSLLNRNEKVAHGVKSRSPVHLKDLFFSEAQEPQLHQDIIDYPISADFRAGPSLIPSQASVAAAGQAPCGMFVRSRVQIVTAARPSQSPHFLGSSRLPVLPPLNASLAHAGDRHEPVQFVAPPNTIRACHRRITKHWATTRDRGCPHVAAQSRLCHDVDRWRDGRGRLALWSSTSDASVTSLATTSSCRFRPCRLLYAIGKNACYWCVIRKAAFGCCRVVR